MQPPGSALAPLTFGDLYGTVGDENYPYPARSPLLSALYLRSVRNVNLEMVTTDVTAGRPFRVPFDPDDVARFFYDEVELARFFPRRVRRRRRSCRSPSR